MNSFNTIHFKPHDYGEDFSPIGEKQNQATTVADLLSVRQFSERTQLTRATVYLAIKRGDIDVVKMGPHATMVVWNERAEAYNNLPPGRKCRPRNRDRKGT